MAHALLLAAIGFAVDGDCVVAKLLESLRQRCVVEKGDKATVRLAASVVVDLAVTPSDMCRCAVNLLKRVQTLDIINNYDGTPETDYEIKVEAVELDDKTEREQNIFMNSPSAMGEFDMEKIKVLVPEIDYKAAGLSEADMNIYGISVMQDEISSELSDTLGDFEEIQRPFEERKAAVKEMKEQIRQQAEQKAEDIESYVMLNFKSYRAKSSFMLRFGFRPDDKIIPGEMFSDMVERVE